MKAPVENIVTRKDCAVEREAVEAAPTARIDEDLPAPRERVRRAASQGVVPARHLVPKRHQPADVLGEPLGNGPAAVLSRLNASPRGGRGLLGLLEQRAVENAFARESRDLIQGRVEVRLGPGGLSGDPVEFFEILRHAPPLHLDRGQEQIEHGIAGPRGEGRCRRRHHDRQQEGRDEGGANREGSHFRHYTEVAAPASQGIPQVSSMTAVISARGGEGRERSPLEDRTIEGLLDLGGDFALGEAVDLRDLGDDEIAGALVHLFLAERERLLLLDPRQVLEDVGDVRQAARAHLVEVLLVTALPVAGRRKDAVLQDPEYRAHVLAPRERAQADAVGVSDRYHHARIVPEKAELITGGGRTFEGGLLDRLYDAHAVVRVDEPVSDLECHGIASFGKGKRRLLPRSRAVKRKRPMTMPRGKNGGISRDFRVLMVPEEGFEPSRPCGPGDFESHGFPLRGASRRQGEAMNRRLLAVRRKIALTWRIGR